MFDAAFLNGETWGFPGAAVEHIETHAAHVFLAGPRAFKIKKDVKLPYLDFSSKEKRQEALAAELEINRIFSAGIYLGLAEVRGEPVLVMRRFAGSSLLSWKLGHGGVDATLAIKLAAMAAASHNQAQRRDTPGASIMTGLGAQLSKAFVDSPDIFRPAETIEFHTIYQAALQASKVLLNERGEKGLVRRCHVDMHAGNIIVEADEPALFDAIEFSEKIATIDVLYDLAFLLMDLWTRAEKRAANLVLNRYLHLRRGAEDLSGLAALPLFLATRAGVRALVSADLAHEQPLRDSLRARGQALDWFRAALAYLRPAAPVLVGIGGLSGTGKSTAAAALAPAIGAPPGAIHVRSDIERKVLAGVDETERLGAARYSREASYAVYDACLGRADAALRAGHSVVLDAVFATPDERRSVEDLARRAGARFQGFWLEAPEEVLKSRVAARQGDASDATPEVVSRQMGYDLGQIGWRRINAAGSASQTTAQINAALTP